MEVSKIEISQTFSQTFGKTESHVKKVWVTADNNREPMIEFSRAAERLTSDDLKVLGNFLIECAKIIENDKELKSE